MEIAQSTNPLTVFVVDDNADGAYMLSCFMELYGHKATIATDPKTGIAMAKAINPDVFFLDIGLPDMDGYELGFELKKQHPNATFIGYSAWKRDEARQKAVGFSFDYFLTKPTPPSDMMFLLDGIGKKITRT